MSTKHAEVVIVGAGILGCALAWRLAARNICRGDAIWVVDAQQLASQATSRAAGLLSLARPAAKSHWIPLIAQTLAAIKDLNAQGHEIPIHQCGAVHVADSDASITGLVDLETTARTHGIHSEWQAPQSFAERLPFMEMQHFKRALWFPNESYTEPYLLASAYQAAARAQGVRFMVGAPALLSGQGSRVIVNIGGKAIRPSTVWVAAGAWSSAVLRPLQLEASQAAVRSHYWITNSRPQNFAAMPMILSSDLRFYARPELGALLFGLREAHGVVMPSDRLPNELSGLEFDPADSQGHETLTSFATQLAHYAPGLMDEQLRHYIAGPSCYTPDGDFLVGSLPGWENLNLLSGCNGAGIAASVGLADIAADLTSFGQPVDERFNPMRFGNFIADSPEWLARCVAARAGKTTG